MTQFLYFVPGHPMARLDRATVANTFAVTALRDLLRSDKSWNADAVTFNALPQDGPGGKVGTLFACLPGGMAIEGFDVDYRPADQTWVEIGNAWLGWYTDNSPTEENLRKERIIPGYQVMLNDGSAWTAPTLRSDKRNPLPMSIGLDVGGKSKLVIRPEYRTWSELGDKLWDWRNGHGSMNNGQLWDAAATCLSLNYQIGPAESRALGLFEWLESEDAPNWFEVLLAALDWQLIRDVVGEPDSKKNTQQPESSAASAG